MGISDEEKKDSNADDVDVEIVDVSDNGSNQNVPDNSGSEGAGDELSPAPSGHKVRISKSDIIRYIIMGVALCVFIFAAVSIFRKLNDYKKAREIYDNASLKVFNTRSETSGETEGPGETQPDSDNQTGYQYLDINFEELRNLSSEAIGWIDIPVCGISYPIVQHSDNEYYLNHTFDDTDDSKGFTWAGAIFLDYRNSPTFDDDHYYVYGHNMYDNSMFGNLLRYDDEEYFKANEGNNVFYIYTEDCIRKYEIFCITDASSETQREAYYFTNDSFTVQDYVDFVTSIALYDTGVSATGDDQIATLFTCQGEAKSPIRHLVHGKLVETIEK